MSDQFSLILRVTITDAISYLSNDPENATEDVETSISNYQKVTQEIAPKGNIIAGRNRYKKFLFTQSR